ncbi:transporter substrate-binding domain-containing protein [Burkholderia multivorans]|uniref:ATP-binding protein n=1 Tax=Burkholderia multivorans TaxID=87883 RepID=UPI001BA3A0F5|nr:ATP-binding protein [Burkholderia multivorans]MBR8123121.1 transporter substrate-binding domain-containing protein [Burkholderia multivorans]MBU9600441.1 transporter substrate-binding domain-containing protein [Burkholderia multivorans]
MTALLSRLSRLRRAIALVLACVPLAGAYVPARGAAPVFTPEERAWIARHPVVRVSFNQDWRPMEYVRNGRMQGVVAGYLAAVTEMTGLRFELAPTRTWADGHRALAEGRIDLLPSLSAQTLPPSLEGRVLRTREYFTSSTVLVGRTSEMRVFRVQDLDGQTVSIKRGGANERMLHARFPHVRTLLRDTIEETLRDVKSGRADFALLCACAAQPFLHRQYAGELHVSGPLADLPVILTMGVRRDDAILKSILDKSLDSISVGQANAIMRRWAGQTDYGSPTLGAIIRYRAKEVALSVLFVLALVATTIHAHLQRQRARRSEQDRSRFFAVLSHEIRTPLNALIGSVELLSRTMPSHEQADLLNIAGSASEALSALLNDILALSRLEAGEIRLCRTAADLAELARQTADVMRIRARDKGLALTITADDALPAALMIDAARVRQILYNLISNAIRFTEAGAIDVALSFAPADAPSAPGTLTIAVSDTGIGIAAADQAVIFDAFRQVESGPGRRQAGTGLGLTICRMLAELMDGSIAVRSTPGVGSVFTVTLPAHAAASCDTASSGDGPALPCSSDGSVVGPPREQRRPVILVIDDHRTNLAVLDRQIRATGCVPVLAETGTQALESFSTGRFDLVLMDLDLGDIDGFTLTRRFRDLEARTGTHTPIVSITASAEPDHHERALASGMDGLLDKPIRADALRTVVSLWCDLDPHRAPAAAASSHDATDLAATYAALLQADLDILDAARQRADHTAALAILHRIKGAALIMSDTLTADACARLQACLGGDDTSDDECRRAFASLRARCRASDTETQDATH